MEAMKLYLSSIEVPTPDDLAELLGKPLQNTSVAIIPNAQDQYSERPRDYKNQLFEQAMTALGMQAQTVDLRNYSDAAELQEKLREFDLIWARGGNTFCLRYEMRRSGFDDVIRGLLEAGVVYGGDSAGALVAGTAINGIESADTPQFAQEAISEGLELVPYVVLPHAENPEFAEAADTVRGLYDAAKIISLNDNQAVIFSGAGHKIVQA
jgi:dipeptidase E